MVKPLAPESTRREDVVGQPVRLSDGRQWWFSSPTVRLYPSLTNGLDREGRSHSRISVEIGHGFPSDIERSVQRVRYACDKGTVREQYEAFFDLAARLLIRAHEISLDDACKLLSVGEDELPRLVREIMAIALGTPSVPESRQGNQ